MNPYHRVINRLKGEHVDKIPNLNIIMTFAAKYINTPYKKYVNDFKVLVEGNLICCDKFGIDMVSAISDPCRELFDFGAKVVFPEDDVPFCKDFLIKDYSDIKKIKIKDPLNSKRMFDRIGAVSLFNAKVKGYYPILGWTEGALAEAADLRGVSELMLDFSDNPEFVIELLELCVEQEKKFALEQIKAGADFIGIGDAVASLIGPKNYCRFALPYEKRIIDEIHKAGAKAKLHVCGDISKILDYICDTGADIIDIDWMVDFNTAVKKFEGKSAACGNFNPVSILLEGNEQVVTNSVISCINAGDNTTFIAAGCEVPRNTSIENMLTVDRILKKY